jgi:hypothetical protein
LHQLSDVPQYGRTAHRAVQQKYYCCHCCHIGPTVAHITCAALDSAACWQHSRSLIEHQSKRAYIDPDLASTHVIALKWQCAASASTAMHIQ